MIADRTGRDQNTIRRELIAMVKEGLLETAKKRVKYADKAVQAHVYRWVE
jgi:DeoR/GlpR family transcriptional regulator of sugar metabolism